MTELLAGLSLGLAAGLVPGPLQALVVTSALERGFGAGWRVAVSPLVSDVPIIAVCLVTLSRVPAVMVTGRGRRRPGHRGCHAVSRRGRR